MVEEEAATVAASRVAAPGAVMVVVSSFAALPHFGRGASVCFFWAREGATLFLAASDARFVAREDELRLHVHAGSGFNSSLLPPCAPPGFGACACPHEWPDALHVKDC